MTDASCKELPLGSSLVGQWFRLLLPAQGVQVRSLVRELRSHMPKSQNQNLKIKEATL